MSSDSRRYRFDCVLVGGGLQSGLIALSMFRAQPERRIALVEAGARLGGNHVWSFHSADVPDEARPIVDPLVVRRWDGYDVRFPNLHRRLDETYASVDSDRFHDVVEAAFRAHPRSRLLLGRLAIEIGANRVVLEGGPTLEADLVIDSRGPGRPARDCSVAFQKFVGLELEVETALDDLRPTIMDATVPQRDGYRFVYVLPFSPHRVLIEDTYFSDTPTLDVGRLRADVAHYAVGLGWSPTRVLREERGVLPLPMSLAARPEPRSPLVGGFAGGWFHPTTGYSFPAATRLALHVASRSPSRVFDSDFERLVDEQRRQARFAVTLNRLLFGGFSPSDRYHVLERFYRLPAPTIRRFYSMTLGPADRAKILCGRPPRGLTLRRLLSRGIPS